MAAAGSTTRPGFSEATRAWFSAAFAEPTLGAGGGVAGDRQRRAHAGHRADRLGQDAGGVPVGDRQAGRRARPRRSEATLPGPLRLPAQGAGGGRRAQPALPADRRPARRPPAWPARARHHRGGSDRGHRGRRAPEDGQQAARHPHHDARVAVPAAHVPGQGGAARRRDGHHRRGPRAGGRQARRAPGPVARTAGCPAHVGRPGAAGGAARTAGAGARAAGQDPGAAHRPVGDRAAGRGGRDVPRRRAAGDDRRAAKREATRPADRRSGRGHGGPADLRAGAGPAGAERRRRGAASGRPGPAAFHLAARRGASARPDPGPSLHDRLRELARPGRAALRPP